MTEKVALIGSGNWGSAVAKIIGRNVVRFDHFDNQVKMWVFEEKVNGQNLTEIINTKHENVKYLPGIQLPENIVACPDLVETCRDASMLVFVVPHQFVASICKQLKGKIQPNCKAISLIKGIDVNEHGFRLITDMIQESLNIRSCILSGANIASEVAEERFCETTIGYRNRSDGELFKEIFHTPSFRVNIVEDVVGVELCGALKNIVAIGGGLVDGLKLGDNTKAAIIRIGLYEMRKFSQMFYKDVRDETFFESCGVADLITTCAGGRNRKVAEAHVVTGKSFDQLEQEMLNGQKLQGTSTAKDMYNILSKNNLCHEFPLMTTIYRICYENLPPIRIVEDI
ncbi:Glycerol-3-phosphate dehydrogenase [Lobosporangium transversale]|uniref:Glycerol-3-phosphate dehydrogenase [NAD(+)] n=1 Tax=Lobosporangium transversale TaxID=64571 RepID=A0A1Y2GYP0_9FUNG|nr:NAD-dependent glycerol-3-phosphate dehydrogenase N-terminus-domain-containing protein [Lobosporangium transversale]KAF9902895.1 Glycerol-3-phosphate dehydrogenase [Lobosporangium transversale]ORZ27420.1 NAD-dependent glycerol-3-phosphate dehydrogenase N-terminus-domain-containing protein [Lobosporangium transversale]|eukprot:XP_021885147.1 NAD-dependent glycerol-3-phosphate dehydrogenase N-terminus-domain-containing protein [Lobosporangium transversale]